MRSFLWVVWVQVVIFGGWGVWGEGAIAQELPQLPPSSSEPAMENLEEAETLEATEDLEEALVEEGLVEEPVLPATAGTVELELPDFLNVVIQGNRDLQNAVLERVVQRQSLTESESTFSPRLTPSVSVRAEGDSSGFSPFGGIDIFGNESENNTGDDDLTFSEDVEISSTLNTPLGTALELSVSPTDEFSRVGVTVRQPLLRGAGQAVNRAPVRQARIAEANNVLALRSQVIDTITTSITQYTSLVQSQEAVAIQAQALERRRSQFERVSALVEAGRQARIDLIDSERSIAEAELGLQEAINRLSQANTDLLNLMGSEVAYQFVVPDNAIAQLFESATRRVEAFQRDQLVELAYQQRPDYQRELSQSEVADLNLLVAKDNRRWDLNWESTARVGDDETRVATGLALRRTFGDESLDTAVTRGRTGILQQQNTLDQLTETIRNEVTDRLRDVTSGLAQVEAAQRATEAAELQLQVTQEKFKRGRDGTTLFDISQQEENLVGAQNAELQARISVLNSIAELERAVGVTLETWEPVVNFDPVLADS